MLTFARPAALLAVGSAAPMRRALASLVASTLVSAGCAPAVSAPPREPPAHLLRAEVAAPAEPLMSPETKSAPSEAHGGDAMPRAIGWFSLSFGITAGIVAVGTSIMMLQQANIRNNDCPGKVCSAAGYNANSQLDGLSGWNVASYIAAAAGIGIGTILLITNPKNDRETAIDVTPNSGGAGLTLRSTF